LRLETTEDSPAAPHPANARPNCEGESVSTAKKGVKEKRTNDEDVDALRDSADERAEFEEEDGHEEGPFAVEKGKDLSLYK
jgi:hypothetical protein